MLKDLHELHAKYYKRLLYYKGMPCILDERGSNQMLSGFFSVRRICKEMPTDASIWPIKKWLFFHYFCRFLGRSQRWPLFIYASQSHIESENFDFFDFFEYMQVWCLFTIKTFDFFEYMQVLCTFGIKMLIFWVYAGLVCLVKIMHFLRFMQVLERYKSQNLQRVCNFEVNKAQIKTGIRFWCSFYFILLKTSNHQNKTNRVCIKHRNLQCFVSMSFNVFNAILGSDTFPPSRGRPWGGATIYIYIFFFIPLIACIHLTTEAL